MTLVKRGGATYIKTEQLFLMHIETFPWQYRVWFNVLLFHFQLLFLTTPRPVVHNSAVGDSLWKYNVIVFFIAHVKPCTACSKSIAKFRVGQIILAIFPIYFER